MPFKALYFCTYAYLNIYANPNRDCTPSLKCTIESLITHLHRVPNIQVIQGDFNLHCTYWDENSDQNLSLAWDMIQAFHKRQMSLVNDESIPTFFHRNHRPQVLDLIWANDNIYSWHGAQVFYDIGRPEMDHKTLTFCMGDNDTNSLQNDHLLRRYIPTGSDEEECLIFSIFEALKNWTDDNPSTHAQQLIDSFTTAWNRFSKPGVAQYNCWWNEACQMAKKLYTDTLLHQTQQGFLWQCKLAKKEYFVKKVEDMIKSRKPWEGTGWIKQQPLPKVPQIVLNGQVLNDLDQMFDKMHEQFAQSAMTPTMSDFVDNLPQHPV